MDESVSGILRRMNVQKIRNDVIWNGEKRGEPDPRTYGERISKAEQTVIDRDSKELLSFCIFP